MSEIALFESFLAQAGVGHWAQALFRNDFNLQTLHLLNRADLQKLRITNKNECQQLLSLAEQVRTLKKPTVQRIATPSTALNPTAAECCRSASNYLDHHRVDRDWPCARSTLASNIGLSFAEDSRPIELILKLTESTSTKVALKPTLQAKKPQWKVVNQRRPLRASDRVFLAQGREVITTVTMKPEHDHGNQSSRCECCLHHVKENAACFSGGQWQYQVKEEVVVSEDIVDHVLMWKPFAAVESLMIENGWRRKLGSVKIGGHVLNLDDLLWKGMKVRRNGDFAVSFPSLSRKEISVGACAPQEKVQDLESFLASSYLKLVEAAEHRDRTKLLLDEECELMAIREEIRADVMETFKLQRNDLESQEAAARKQIEDHDLEDALDTLWDALQECIRHAVLAENNRLVRERAQRICIEQFNALAALELIDREAIISAEEAEWCNYCKLVARFNAQVRALLAGANDHMTVTRGLRCPICNKCDCQFFKVKWTAHWKRDSVVTEKASQQISQGNSVSALIARVQEHEYEDFIKEYPVHQATPRPPPERLWKPKRPQSASPRERTSVKPLRFGLNTISPKRTHSTNDDRTVYHL